MKHGRMAAPPRIDNCSHDGSGCAAIIVRPTIVSSPQIGVGTGRLPGVTRRPGTSAAGGRNATRTTNAKPLAVRTVGRYRVNVPAPTMAVHRLCPSDPAGRGWWAPGARTPGVFVSPAHSSLRLYDAGPQPGGWPPARPGGASYIASRS